MVKMFLKLHAFAWRCKYSSAHCRVFCSKAWFWWPHNFWLLIITCTLVSNENYSNIVNRQTFFAFMILFFERGQWEKTLIICSIKAAANFFDYSLLESRCSKTVKKWRIRKIASILISCFLYEFELEKFLMRTRQILKCFLTVQKHWNASDAWKYFVSTTLGHPFPVITIRDLRKDFIKQLYLISCRRQHFRKIK